MRAADHNLKILTTEGPLVRQHDVNERQIRGTRVFKLVVRSDLQRWRVAWNEADLGRFLDGAVPGRERGVTGIATQQKKKREQNQVERARSTAIQDAKILPGRGER